MRNLLKNTIKIDFILLCFVSSNEENKRKKNMKKCHGKKIMMKNFEIPIIIWY